jgi:RNA polymerase sigma factor (sigma-70 family)
MSLSDAALIARVTKHKDQHAFRQLVLRYQSQVRLWAQRLSRGDAGLADDLAQETFIKAYAGLPGFRADAKFSTWLYRIAFNVAASRWRNKKLDWCDLEEAEDTQVTSCQVQAFAAQQDVESAMLQLSEPQQLAIKLCFQDGFTHEEAAEIMNVPLGTLKAHVARGKRRLQTLLSAWDQAL